MLNIIYLPSILYDMNRNMMSLVMTRVTFYINRSILMLMLYTSCNYPPMMLR